jgi:hypothetical protein
MTQHVRNILKVYRRSTPEDHLQGETWYDQAKIEAKDIASRYGLPIRTVVGVMAALSPNIKWKQNVKDAATMCRAWVNGDNLSDFKCSTYNTMKAKGWSILADGLDDDDDVLGRLNGQKIRSFYSNILGLDEVTIDGHAINIALGKRQALQDNKTNIGKKRYKELQAAYIRAAKRVGVEPHVLQAITWTTWRREHGIK